MREHSNLNVSLIPELIRFIGAEVSSGRYRSGSEVSSERDQKNIERAT